VPVVFTSLWDRIVEYLRYEGKVTSREIGDLSYCADADSNITWHDVNKAMPINNEKRSYRRPQIFRGTRLAENLLRKYTHQGHLMGWPSNREAKWREA